MAPLAALTVAGAACSGGGVAAKGDAAAPATVAVARIARGDITQSLTSPAEFRPYQEIEVHAKVAGYVKSIGVDVGDHVKVRLLSTDVPRGFIDFERLR